MFLYVFIFTFICSLFGDFVTFAASKEESFVWHSVRTHEDPEVYELSVDGVVFEFIKITDQDKSFYMMPQWVTQAQWLRVTGEKPSFFKADGEERRPIESVSWDTVQQKFLSVLTEKIAGRGFGGVVSLPTDHQWRQAAQQNLADDFFEQKSEYAHYGQEWRLGTTVPVDHKRPGKLNMHMCGNVWEWTADLVRSHMSRGSGGQVVLRGGAWNSREKDVGPFAHRMYTKTACGNDIGFRLVRHVSRTTR